MLNIFRRKSKKIVEIPYNDPPPGMYQGVWERKRMPSPGAQRYAWQSLALAQFSPIGPSVSNRDAILPLSDFQQSYVAKAITLDGIPLTAGQIISQPLYDPDAGYGGPEFLRLNNPHQKHSEPIGGVLL